MKSRERCVLSAVVVFLILTSSVYGERQLIDLGTAVTADCINNNGQAVGSVVVGSASHACLFDSSGGGATIDLGTISSFAPDSGATSINDNGKIVGNIYDNTNGTSRACFFDETGGGVNIDLGTLGGTSSLASGINNSGQIVGRADVSATVTRACIFDPSGNGQNMSLGTLGGGYYLSEASSINNNGKIVGTSDTGTGYSHACLFDETGGGSNIDLGGLVGDLWSMAMSINDAGQIVGKAWVDSSYSHACLFDETGGGVNTDLGTLGGSISEALCINNLGQIVGTSYNSEGNARACLFEPTGSGNNIDLNTFIDPLSGWSLYTANYINDDGWIVGCGNINGQTHAFLLTPEPGTVLLLGLGGLTLLRRKRR